MLGVQGATNRAEPGSLGSVPPVDVAELLSLFDGLVQRLRTGLSEVEDWGSSGRREGQYHPDVLADAVLVEGLVEAGVRVLSEESGLSGSGPVTVVVDPIDGSTNASLGIPWYATSLCAVDDRGPLCALVENLATGERFEAVRDAGATCDGQPIRARPPRPLGEATIAVSGWPGRHAGWRQYRAMGAAALDLCAVAAGRFDGYVDCDGAHGVWDYLGGWLICRESGAHIADHDGRDLVVLDPAARRGPVAAASVELLDELVLVRSGPRGGGPGAATGRR